MAKLFHEAETDCDRMAAEEAVRRRHFAAESAAWKERVSSAAEEVRSSFARGFEPTRGVGPGPARSSTRFSSGGCRSPRGGRIPPLPTQSARRATSSNSASGNVDLHEAAWSRLEGKLESSTASIGFMDIPWPREATYGITGVHPGDQPVEAKRRLAAALRRWHPDKWRRILDRVPEAEQARVMERVKTIAQRLLDEKARLTAPGGPLHGRRR
mmetsp:Transcript_20703/g.40479  ORF Transcript_20703/g.40479 Transcript_20703/m.40479 type:complete len:213 (+) Transcript_20703:641-1279(+)